MGKREENKTAKLLDREIIDGIKEQLKGTGWKKKHNSFFREINDNFYYVTAQPIFKFDNGTPTITVLASSNAKPMGIDPIYWDIAEMPENKNEPLSFRAWAAFKTNALSFNHAKPLGHPTASVREVIDLFIEWKIEEIDRISKMLKSRKFSDVFRKLTNENIDKHSNPITLICTLILERCPEQALEIARQHASSSYQNLFVDGNSNDRVNFYELTILYLAGRKAFEAERQIQLSKS